MAQSGDQLSNPLRFTTKPPRAWTWPVAVVWNAMRSEAQAARRVDITCGNRRSPQLTRQERFWWLPPTVIFWWDAIFIRCRMEGHNLHYADESIIHEPNSSQNSKTQLFDLRIATARPVLLLLLFPSQQACSPTLSGLLGRQRSQRSSSLGGARALASTDASFIREVSSHTGDVD